MARVRTLAVLAVLAAAGSAPAGFHTEAGDAGQLLGTAQATTGLTPFEGIRGTISSVTDVDLYQIVITNPAAFSATTVGTPGTIVDTQLFLFTAGGLGVVTNDDAPGGGVRSTILPGAVTTAGIYFLAISGFDIDPLSSAGYIFPFNFTGQNGPTGLGGGSPLASWDGAAFGFNSGTYQINITGADFVTPVPAPPAAALALMGLATAGGLTRLRRRLARSAA